MDLPRILLVFHLRRIPADRGLIDEWLPQRPQAASWSASEAPLDWTGAARVIVDLDAGKDKNRQAASRLSTGSSSFVPCFLLGLEIGGVRMIDSGLYSLDN